MELPRCPKCGKELKEILEVPEHPSTTWVWNEERKRYVPYENPSDEYLPTAQYLCNYCGEDITDEAYEFFEKHKEV